MPKGAAGKGTGAAVTSSGKRVVQSSLSSFFTRPPKKTAPLGAPPTAAPAKAKPAVGSALAKFNASPKRAPPGDGGSGPSPAAAKRSKAGERGTCGPSPAARAAPDGDGGPTPTATPEEDGQAACSARRSASDSARKRVRRMLVRASVASRPHAKPPHQGRVLLPQAMHPCAASSCTDRLGPAPRNRAVMRLSTPRSCSRLCRAACCPTQVESSSDGSASEGSDYEAAAAAMLLEPPVKPTPAARKRARGPEGAARRPPPPAAATGSSKAPGRAPPTASLAPAPASGLGRFSRPGGKEGGDRAAAAGGAAGGFAFPPKGAKLTPLEKQFVEVKRTCVDTLLLVEVGYKYQFFGEDAEIAAQVLHIMCYKSHK